MSTKATLFERIVELGDTRLSPAPSAPKWRPSVKDCVTWLEKEGLTRVSRSLTPDPTRDPAGFLFRDSPIAFGIPSHRAERRRRADLEALKSQYRANFVSRGLSDEKLNRLWQELKNPSAAIRTLELARVPADALAFYRPFHFSPHEEWGIYIMIEPLLSHCRRLFRVFDGKLVAFDLQTLIGCVLFEVFHHEFFHHLCECAATTIEIASASFGSPKPIFNNYWDTLFQDADGLGPHPDHPLEEALANAYAYNSFSFLSRTQIGCKLVWVKVYQEVLKKCWELEPAGYRSAANYINDGYVTGGAQLLAMILSSPALDPASLMLLAKTVLPNGNSAFLQKPDIPTYLVGSVEIIDQFTELVPTPNETYTNLFWLGDTSKIDEYLRGRKQREDGEKKKRRRW